MSFKNLIDTKQANFTRCLPSDFLDEAVSIMVGSQRNAVAVIESGNVLKGILTDHDIIQAVHVQQSKGTTILKEQVQDWMSTNVVSCDVGTKLTAALKLMGKHHIRHLIVNENTQPVAIISIRDILRKIHEHDELEVNILRDIAIASRANFAA